MKGVESGEGGEDGQGWGTMVGGKMQTTVIEQQ